MEPAHPNTYNIQHGQLRASVLHGLRLRGLLVLLQLLLQLLQLLLECPLPLVQLLWGLLVQRRRLGLGRGHGVLRVMLVGRGSPTRTAGRRLVEHDVALQQLLLLVGDEAIAVGVAQLV